MHKKIAIIGPESTGKSTLCEQLAKHYNSLWCPEFAREYLLENGTDYDYDDLLTIAKGQISLEQEYISKTKTLITQSLNPNSSPDNYRDPIHLPKAFGTPLFIDTDMYVMKVWCEFVFSNCHRYILDQIIERKYDLYLLCNNDLPWVKDELREYPDLETRQRLYLIYKDIMINQPVPWIDIRGDYEQRLEIAIHAVDKLLHE